VLNSTALNSRALKAVVITASDRAAAGGYLDRSGPILVAGLQQLGCQVASPQVVCDGAAVGEAIRAAVAQGSDIVLTTGGTGLAPSDQTPEQTAPLLSRQLPGIAEALRAAGVAKGVPTAVLSRGLAGTVGRCLVINLPGSPGACRDALAVLLPILGHAVEQLGGGGDHGPEQVPGPQPGDVG
jgi:molybdenum cofactor synthesis domain-containing protein